jgi:hypothetical protein
MSGSASTTAVCCRELGFLDTYSPGLWFLPEQRLVEPRSYRVNRWRKIARYIAALVASFVAFLLLNVAYAIFFPACIDCHAHVGIPFAYLDTGNELGEGGLLPWGTFADLLVVAATSGVLSVLLERALSSKRS